MLSFLYILSDISFFVPSGPPVIVGMSINIASIDSISEVNMVSCKILNVFNLHTTVLVTANSTVGLGGVAAGEEPSSLLSTKTSMQEVHANSTLTKHLHATAQLTRGRCQYINTYTVPHWLPTTNTASCNCWTE